MGHRGWEGEMNPGRVRQLTSPWGTSFESFMAAAQSGQMRRGKEKYWSRSLGYSTADWDAEAGRFTTRASGARFRDTSYNSAHQNQSAAWRGLSGEQRQQVVDAAQRQHAEELLAPGRRAAGETMLEGLKAKSETMEQLVANRRALRDAERKAQRGLY